MAKGEKEVSKELISITLTSGEVLVIQQEDLKYAIDNGTSTDCFICDSLETSSQSVIDITNNFALTSLLALRDGTPIAVNPQAVDDIIEQAAQEVWIRFDCGETKVIADTIENIQSVFNLAILNAGEITVSGDYTVTPNITKIFVDTPNITITIPADRVRDLIIINRSDGNIILDPLVNTIEGEDTGLITSGSSWSITLENTTWRLI